MVGQFPGHLGPQDQGGILERLRAGPRSASTRLGPAGGQVLDLGLDDGLLLGQLAEALGPPGQLLDHRRDPVVAVPVPGLLGAHVEQVVGEPVLELVVGRPVEHVQVLGGRAPPAAAGPHPSPVVSSSGPSSFMEGRQLVHGQGLVEARGTPCRAPSRARISTCGCFRAGARSSRPSAASRVPSCLRACGQGHLQVERLAVVQQFPQHRRALRAADGGQGVHRVHQQGVAPVGLQELQQGGCRPPGCGSP